MKLPEIKFIAVAPVAILLGALLIVPGSFAAFSAPTSTPTSNWSAGTVVLGDDDSGAALFSGGTIAPGDEDTRCIVVTSTGSLPAEVRMFGAGPASTNGLADSLLLTVTLGTGGSFGSCTDFVPLPVDSVLFEGTLAQFAAGATSFADGLGGWQPTGGTESRTYRLHYSFDPAASDTVQGGTAEIAFTWEAQNI